MKRWASSLQAGQRRVDLDHITGTSEMALMQEHGTPWTIQVPQRAVCAVAFCYSCLHLHAADSSLADAQRSDTPTMRDHIGI